MVGEPVAGQDEPGSARDENAADDNTAVAATRPRAEQAKAGTASDIDRLNRLLEFVVRQEPRLNWAVGITWTGQRYWSPTSPTGGYLQVSPFRQACLLEPERRTGRVSALIGDTTRVVTYAPGDSLRRSVDFAATKSSLQPRKLPAIEDLGRVLSEATRRRDGCRGSCNGWQRPLPRARVSSTRKSTCCGCILIRRAISFWSSIRM